MSGLNHTTVITAADRIDGGDPGRPHGYAGEIEATLIPTDRLQAKIVELAEIVAADHHSDQPPLLI
ncbi:MAG: hypoxanthine phosphoribosyltransferase, partial [Nakamurella sp.]